KNIWATIILYGMFFITTVRRQEPWEKGKSYMLVANHTSMMDIMMMLKVSKNLFVLVGKQELAKISLIGFFYKCVFILVDRSSLQSRTLVYKRAQRRLNQGLSICIFPEGGVPDDSSIVLDSFKDGAFKLAIAHQIPIVPVTFLDNKKRFSYEFFSGSPGRMRAVVMPFIKTQNMDVKHSETLKQSTRSLILSALQKRNSK